MKLLSCVQLFVSPWTIAHQAPPRNFPGKSTGVGCHFLLQGIFPTQGLNPRLADALPSEPPGSPLRELSPSTKSLLQVPGRELPWPVGWMELVNPILAGKTSCDTFYMVPHRVPLGNGTGEVTLLAIIPIQSHIHTFKPHMLPGIASK